MATKWRQEHIPTLTQGRSRGSVGPKQRGFEVNSHGLGRVRVSDARTACARPAPRSSVPAPSGSGALPRRPPEGGLAGGGPAPWDSTDRRCGPEAIYKILSAGECATLAEPGGAVLTFECPGSRTHGRRTGMLVAALGFADAALTCREGSRREAPRLGRIRKLVDRGRPA